MIDNILVLETLDEIYFFLALLMCDKQRNDFINNEMVQIIYGIQFFKDINVHST